MNSFYCSWPVKSSGELKSRGVKLLPGKDNTNKLSLSKSFIFLMQLFSLFCFFIFFVDVRFAFWVSCFFRVSFLAHHSAKWLSYSTRFCRSAVFFFLLTYIPCCPRHPVLKKIKEGAVMHNVAERKIFSQVKYC